MLIQDKPKQVLVFNRALNMPSGKLAAQLSHASLGCVLQLFDKISFVDSSIESTDITTGVQYSSFFKKESAEYKWINEEFTKIVCYVKSEEALLKLYENAQAAGLNSVLIKDAGHTFFDKPTYTCVGIGPAFSSELEPVTGKLQLYKD